MPRPRKVSLSLDLLHEISIERDQSKSLEALLYSTTSLHFISQAFSPTEDWQREGPAPSPEGRLANTIFTPAQQP